MPACRRSLRVRHPREIHALAIEDRDRPVFTGALLFHDGLEHLDRRAEGDVIDHFAVTKHRYLDGDDRLLLHRANEEVGVVRLFCREHFRHEIAIVAQRQACRIWCSQGKQRAPIAIRHQYDAVLAVLIEEARSDGAEALEIAAAQRIGESEDLKAAGHTLHFGIEHEANAAHRFQYPARGFFAILFVMVEDDADRENDQRQHRSCNQKCEANWQRKLRHAGFPQYAIGRRRQTAASIGEACETRQVFCARAAA